MRPPFSGFKIDGGDAVRTLRQRCGVSLPWESPLWDRVVLRGNGVITAAHSGLLEIMGMEWVGSAAPIKAFPREPRLHPFQEIAVGRLMSRAQGYLVAPTGAGKTVMALAIIARLRQRGIILTPTKQIAEQTVKACEKFLGVKAGRVYSGKDEREAPVAVATYQTVMRWEKPADDWGIVVSDEVHRVLAKVFVKALCAIRAHYRYGMTATLDRQDELRLLFPLLLGPHIVRVSPKDAEKILAGTEIWMLEYPNSGVPPWQFCEEVCGRIEFCGLKPENCERFRKGIYQFVLQALVEDDVRNGLIVDAVMKLLKQHEYVLVLTARVKHARWLGQLLMLNTDTPVFVAVGQKAGWRKEVEAFRREGGVLVATESLLGEGTDFPEVSAMVLATPAGGRVRVRQRLGRILRGMRSGRKVVVDVMDAGWARRWAWARLNTYRRMKKEGFNLRIKRIKSGWDYKVLEGGL